MELSFGIPIRFVLYPTGSRLRNSGVFNDDLSIVATNRIGERIKGKVSLDKSNGEFECTVLPRSREWYKVNIQWNGDHISGSPFRPLQINFLFPVHRPHPFLACYKLFIISTVAYMQYPHLLLYT